MRCSMCGHESPPGSSFCLNCGSSLAAPPPAQTPAAASGLPTGVCPVCRTENPTHMKFCRSCGASLAAKPAPAPAPAPPPAAPPPMAYGAPGMAGMPPAGAFPTPPPAAPRTSSPGIGPTMAANPTTPCPRCGTQTPAGFQFCQQCGLHMGALQPTDPGAGGMSGPRIRPPSVAPALAGLPTGPLGTDATLAVEPRPPTPMPYAAQNPPVAVARTSSSPQVAAMAGGAWGQAVLVNRDGSDGQRFPLAGDTVIVGRTGADIVFEDDRFLARQHARIERTAEGVTIRALDTLNGVFRKADTPVDLADGTILLVGREVLRFEVVEAEEKNVHPLVRHGVALFGSPPREPWGRLVQIIPSGGYRDVRHLIAEEIVLGREEGEIVYRDDAFMSRRHAAITWNGKRAQITDLGSSNGTFVKVVAIALKHGDHVRMGDQLLRIELGR